MIKIDTFIQKLNIYQSKHKSLSIFIAVIKKYNDDSAGREAALLTYYGFLSLFPLLLIVITLTDVIVGNGTELSNTIIHGLTSYFPLLGEQLTSHVHRYHAGGLALFAGILFTLYGTRGLADTFRRSIQNFWFIPNQDRESFPISTLKNLTIIVIGGLGFILTSIIAAETSSAGKEEVFQILSLVVNFTLLFLLFNLLINYILPRRIKPREIWPAAAIAALGIVILQLIGGYVLAHELKRLDALYSYFALSLGLIFWIYLQAQIVYYSIEIAVVTNLKLWPISLVSKEPTVEDKRLKAFYPNH